MKSLIILITPFLAGSIFQVNGQEISVTTKSATSFVHNSVNAEQSPPIEKNKNIGFQNLFLGHQCGKNNETGYFNSFFGNSSGENNDSGQMNSFFGTKSGFANTAGNFNSFFGANSGVNNVRGFGNTFIGSNSGSNNVKGCANVFIGVNAGQFNTKGNKNVLIGVNSGSKIENANSITLIGAQTDVADPSLENSTAIGADVQLTESNSFVLGNEKVINWSFGPKKNINGILTFNPSLTKAKLNASGIWVNSIDFSKFSKIKPVSSKDYFEKFDQIKIYELTDQDGILITPNPEELNNLFEIHKDKTSISGLEISSINLLMIQELNKKLKAQQLTIDLLAKELQELKKNHNND